MIRAGQMAQRIILIIGYVLLSLGVFFSPLVLLVFDLGSLIWGVLRLSVLFGAGIGALKLV